MHDLEYLEEIANTQFKKGDKPITVRINLQTRNAEFLLLQRSQDKKKHPEKWDIAGGGVDEGETPLEAAIRETSEETGFVFGSLFPEATLETKNKLRILFWGVVDHVSDPELDREHDRFEWRNRGLAIDNLPENMHPKTQKLIKVYSEQEGQRFQSMIAAHDKFRKLGY